MDRLWQAAGEIRTGYIHLEGPAGTGKSYLARAMKQESGERHGMPALLYHILPGERTDYRNFIMLLADEAREQFPRASRRSRARTRRPMACGRNFANSSPRSCKPMARRG